MRPTYSWQFRFESRIPRVLTVGVCQKHVELCHIKPIHSFSETSTLGEINSENNVVQLCPNCHWEFDNGFLDIIK